MRAGLVFPGPVRILTLPVWFPGGSALLSLAAPNQAARWALSTQGARWRPHPSHRERLQFQHKCQDLRKVLTTLW